MMLIKLMKIEIAVKPITIIDFNQRGIWNLGIILYLNSQNYQRYKIQYIISQSPVVAVGQLEGENANPFVRQMD